MNLIKQDPTKYSQSISSEQLVTTLDFIYFAARQFKQSKIYFGHGTDNAWDEAVYLVLGVSRLPLNVGRKSLQRELLSEEKVKLLKAIDSRIKERIPVAYLTHEAWFAGLSFYVDERVLIPRSPLAELIQNRFIPWVNPKKVRRVLDIGTGSGCIAISIAYAFPKAEIDTLEISQDAINVAAINIAKHKKATKNVRWLKSDLFAALKGERYDIIVSNPPYVSNLEIDQVPKEYLYEPRSALVAGKNGDEVVTKIISQAASHLASRGILVVEVGNSKPLILKKYPKLPLVWLEFAHGEGEVFLITKEELQKHSI